MSEKTDKDCGSPDCPICRSVACPDFVEPPETGPAIWTTQSTKECPNLVCPRESEPDFCGWPTCPTCGAEEVPGPTDEVVNLLAYEEKRSILVLAANDLVTACAGSTDPIPAPLVEPFLALIDAVGVLRAEAVKVAEG